MRNLNHFQILSAVILGVCVTPSAVRAEIVFLVPGEFGWRKSVPLQFVFVQAVVSDLGLSEDVAQRLQQLQIQIHKEVEEERARQKPRPADPGSQKPDRYVRMHHWNDEIVHAVRNRHAKELNELLTPQQQDRLHEIHLQFSAFPTFVRTITTAFGQPSPTGVLRDPAVAEKLGLTDEQRSQIYEIYKEVTMAEMREIKGGRTDPDSNALHDQAPEKIMSILTEPQRREFERLKGAPLKQLK